MLPQSHSRRAWAIVVEVREGSAQEVSRRGAAHLIKKFLDVAVVFL